MISFAVSLQSLGLKSSPNCLLINWQIQSARASGILIDSVTMASAIVLTMPNHKRAITPEEKFLNYSLNPNNPNNNGKAEAYQKALCYNKNNFKDLRDQIHNAVSSGRVKPYQIKFSEHGIKYCFEIPVRGPNGKTKPVIAVYQIDKGQTAPRMITNYVKGK